MPVHRTGNLIRAYLLRGFLVSNLMILAGSCHLAHLNTWLLEYTQLLHQAMCQAYPIRHLCHTLPKRLNFIYTLFHAIKEIYIFLPYSIPTQCIYYLYRISTFFQFTSLSFCFFKRYLSCLHHIHWPLGQELSS